MMQIRHIRRVTFWLLFVFLLLVLIVAGLSIYIPRVLESTILPTLAENAGIENLSVHVRHIGFHGADIGPLSLGSSSRPTRTLDSIQLHYSPSALYSRHIESVVLKGIALSCEYKGGEFLIHGFDLKQIIGTLQKKDAGSETTERRPPLSIGRIGIEQATVSLKWQGRQIRLPMRLEIIPESRTWQSIDLTLQLYPRDQTLHLSATIDTSRKTARLEFNARDVHPDVFSDFTGIIPGLTASGSIDVEGTVEMGFDPIQIREGLVSIWVRNGYINYNRVQLRTQLRTGPGEEDRPFHITLSGKGRDWKLSAVDIAGISPIPFHIPQVTSTLAFSGEGLEQAGDGTLIIGPLKRELPDTLRILEPIILPIHYSASYSKNKKWSLDLVTFKLTAANVKMAAKSTKIDLPRVLMDGRYSGRNGSDITLKGKLSFSDAKVFDPTFRIVIDDIGGAIPLEWPIHDPGEKGKITIGHLGWQDLDIGSITAAIQQNQDGLFIDGEHTSALFPGLPVGIKGRASFRGADLPTAEINCDVAQYHIPSDLTLGRIFPAVKDLTLTGTLDADLKIRLKGTAVTGTLNGELSDGSIALEEKDVVIEGIHMGLFLPELPNLRSAPKQHLRFREASFGALNATDGRIDFQIESADSLFIERSSLKWGGGNLYTHAMRIRPEGEDYNLTVYCDRLNLARLLEQIGSVKAEGSGTVNGRIPIRYSNNKLHFEDGFLYSTPGDGGSIRLTETEILTAGIAPDTPQHTQLELAREALRDYDYKWVKLNLETREDILLVGMQLDGKPASPLPFVYEKELGRFVRIEAGGKGSNFQGISLDVNFKAPLDRILHYGGTLKEVFSQ